MADQQGQQQQPRGILPSETLNALDNLVDRLNFSSGRLPNVSNTTTNDDDVRPLPIRALLVGTNEGVGLSRSLGSAHTASQLRSNNMNGGGGDPSSFSHSGSMSEEVLSSIETVWATLVSAAPPHVMAATAAAAAAAANSNSSNGGGENEEKKEDGVPTHIQPPHPLLSPLQLGDTIKTVTATYDNCTLIHIHMPPLVVTFVALPEANIGAIRCTALPLLKVLLEPVRRALVRSRGGGVAGGNTVIGSQNGGAGQVMGGMDLGPGMMMEQMMAAGGQMQQQHHQQQQQQQQQQMMFGQQQQQQQLQQVYDQQQQQYQQQQQQQFQQQQQQPSQQQQLLLQQQLLNQQMLLQQQQMYQGGNNLDPQQLYQQQLYMLQQQYQQQQQQQQQF